MGTIICIPMLSSCNIMTDKTGDRAATEYLVSHDTW